MQEERIEVRGLGEDSANGAHRLRHGSRHPCHDRNRRLRNGLHLRCGRNPCRDARWSPPATSLTYGLSGGGPTGQLFALKIDHAECLDPVGTEGRLQLAGDGAESGAASVEAAG